MWNIALGVLLCGSLAAGHGGHAHGGGKKVETSATDGAQPRKPLTGAYKPSSTPAAASLAAADGGAASSWALTLVAAAAFGVFSLKLYSKADGAEAGPLLAKAT